MTRKHFEAIAERIHSQLKWISTPEETLVLRTLAQDLAFDFAGFNPNFSRARFLTACGF